ncbi:MAG: branched-chain amino acid ABC transporter permease [Syntrophomonadaceae bacterium]|jgi:branched-subunit amino acid ABC-type transport system permease component
METSQLTIQFLNGLSYGLLLFLLAAGLSLIFGLMGTINMAHGSFFMLGAYLGYAITTATGDFLLAVIGASAAMAMVGVLLERCFFRKLYKMELNQVLLSFGFTYIFMDIARGLWGGTPRSLATPGLLEGSVVILGGAFPLYRLALVVIGLGVALLLWLFLERTRTGIVIRAGVDDKQMVEALGTNIRSYFTAIFALGAFLAAFGGVIGAPIIGVYPGLDFEILVLALVIVVVGGLGTLKGAFWGSILIGLTESFAKIIFPDYSIMTIYITMIIVLLFKPAGLFGKGGP